MVVLQHTGHRRINTDYLLYVESTLPISF